MVGSGHCGKGSFCCIHARCVGPRAWLQGEFAANGMSVWCPCRTVGREIHPSLSVGFHGYSMKPSGPGRTLLWRLIAGRLSRTVVPMVPPGTSRAPTSETRSVRAQAQSYPPQPLATVLPSTTATGRKGNSRPSTSTVSPIRAWSTNSWAMRRIVSASTPQMSAAHSGV